MSWDRLMMVGLGLFNNAAEGRGVGDGEVGEDFAVRVMADSEACGSGDPRIW